MIEGILTKSVTRTEIPIQRKKEALARTLELEGGMS